MGREHLLGEHHEVHINLNGGWASHPESRRFQYEGGRKYLILRHELLRSEMDRRWPGRHTIWTHPSIVEVEYHDIPWLDLALSRGTKCTTSSFPRVMDSLGFPKAILGYDTPWDKYGISQEEYVTATEIGLLMKGLEKG